MNHRFAVFALAVAFCVSLTGLTPALSAASGSGGPASASAKKGKGQKKKAPKKKVFLVCKHGCQFRTIQKAVNAAGAFKHEKKNAKTRAIVEVMPGKYVEGVVLDGTRRKKNFEGLTIIGAKKNPRKTILEGKNAKGELGAAQNGIEVVDVDGVVMKNMWARNYESNGFFVHAATQSGQHCDGYTMNNLIASGNRSYGLFAKGCLGGKMLNSTGFRQGDSAFYIGETPCDTTTWTNHGTAPAPCQAKPKWSVLRNDVSYENVLGYSGTNSKYVLITESDFFNNGAGIVPNTLDSEGYEPNGWNVFEKNNVFWNNYNYFLAGSAFKTVSGGLGQLTGITVNYPTGVGDRPLRRRQQHRPRQQRLRQLQVGRRLVLGPGRKLRRQRGGRRQEHQQPDHRKLDRARRGGSQRGIRLLERRHRRRQLLVRQHGRLELRAGQRLGPAEHDLPGLPAAGGARRPGEEPQARAPACR